MNNLLEGLLNGKDVDEMTAQEKLNRESLIGTILTGIAQGSGLDAQETLTGANTEFENNAAVDYAFGSPKYDKALQQYCSGLSAGLCGAKPILEILNVLEVDKLKDAQNNIRLYLENKSESGLTDAEIQFFAIIYAGNEALFPTSALDAVPGGKSVALAGVMVKKGAKVTNAVADAKKITKAEGALRLGKLLLLGRGNHLLHRKGGI